MSPLVALSDWLRGQDPTIKSDMVGLMLMLLQDGFDPSEDGIAIEKNLLQWLSDNDTPSYRIVGKAVTFRACFEHLFRKSFTPQRWVDSEGMLRSIVKEKANDFEYALRGLTEARQAWIAVGKSWDNLVCEHLSDEALYEWQGRTLRLN
jgi:hypothetical protein